MICIIERPSLALQACEVGFPRLERDGGVGRPSANEHSPPLARHSPPSGIRDTPTQSSSRTCKEGLLPGRIRKAKELGCPRRMPYARPADPEWCRYYQYGGVDSDCGRRGPVVWGEASSPRAWWARVPHETWRGPFCNCRATGDGFPDPTRVLSLGIGTRSRPGHADGRPGSGRTRASDCGSSGGSDHPPANTLHGAGRGGANCDSAANSSQRRPGGPGGRGDGTTGSNRKPIAVAAPGYRRSRSPGVRVVQPGVARTRTTGKSAMVR